MLRPPPRAEAPVRFLEPEPIIDPADNAPAPSDLPTTVTGCARVFAEIASLANGPEIQGVRVALSGA
eukprot:13203427-Alexandrium_andersonii.AAC.1